MESNWENTSLSLGSIRQKQSIDFDFQSKEVLTDILKIVPGCGSCTEVKGYSPEDKTLSLTFKAGAFPEHFIYEGRSSYNTNKEVSVFYTYGKTDVLSFNITVYK